jgi:ribosomal protein L23
MALFSRKKNTEAKEAAAPAAKPAVQGASVARDLTHVLKHARITEKATMSQTAGVYVFEISERATKRDVMQAVKQLYSVSPRKVAVVNTPKKVKRSMRTGRVSVVGGSRKAYVYLKQGDSITIA